MFICVRENAGYKKPFISYFVKKSKSGRQKNITNEAHDYKLDKNTDIGNKLFSSPTYIV